MAENKRKPAPVVEVAEELEEEEQAPKVERKPKKKAKTPMIFVRFMDVFGVFKRNEIAKAMPFVLFVTFLIICYIGNSYYAERVIRDIEKTKNQLKERRAEYISTMSQLMSESKQSEVARELSAYELKESTQPPQKIFAPEPKKK
ncbi:MAG TPA: FtsL-like putative cell division protein [Bacteroidia bacterium]|mgnify:FL=1|nr:hypothetical protein [Bacteroidia bacterium]HQV99937.1 FtsL-like putative cell division protein [Bacteroidia bacterium]HQW21877.1 FtsL-like putative cell division protein [Bacteroidia bacterium]